MKTTLELITAAFVAKHPGQPGVQQQQDMLTKALATALAHYTNLYVIPLRRFVPVIQFEVGHIHLRQTLSNQKYLQHLQASPAAARNAFALTCVARLPADLTIEHSQFTFDINSNEPANPKRRIAVTVPDGSKWIQFEFVFGGDFACKKQPVPIDN